MGAPYRPRRPERYRLVTARSGASFALLMASFLWAHHWGPRADAIVAGWAITTLIAGAGGVRMGGRTRPSWLATSAIVFAAVSLLALLTAAAS